MISEAVVVFATFVPETGREEEVHEVLKTVLLGTRAEPGNEVYDLYRSETDGAAAFHLFERYVDQGALQAHRDSGHYKRYRQDIAELLAEPIRVAVLSELDVSYFDLKDPSCG